MSFEDIQGNEKYFSQHYQPQDKLLQGVPVTLMFFPAPIYFWPKVICAAWKHHGRDLCPEGLGHFRDSKLLISKSINSNHLKYNYICRTAYFSINPPIERTKSFIGVCKKCTCP